MFSHVAARIISFKITSDVISIDDIYYFIIKLNYFIATENTTEAIN